MQIIIFGKPGCGKTTLGKLVAKKLQIPFRDIDDTIPPYFKELNRKGVLVPPKDVLSYFLKEIEDIKKINSFVGAQVFLKDQYAWMIFNVLPQAKFFYLDVPDVILKKRLKQREHFYKEELHEKAVFETVTIPHKVIDGTKSVEELAKTIILENEKFK